MEQAEFEKPQAEVLADREGRDENERSGVSPRRMSSEEFEARCARLKAEVNLHLLTLALPNGKEILRKEAIEKLVGADND